MNSTADTVNLLFRPKARREATMATYTPRGGFIITLNNNNSVGQTTIDDATLLKVTEALDIKRRAGNLEIDKRISEIKSIYIFRGE
jgi:hypothetical protein